MRELEKEGERRRRRYFYAEIRRRRRVESSERWLKLFAVEDE